MTDDYAARARDLVGCRFRAQGRHANTGFDCIGLIATVFGIPEHNVPRDYRLRGGSLGRLRDGLIEFFRAVPAGRARRGDVLLFAVAADQPHLGVLTDDGFVHAHAGLGRVVETPGVAPWPVLRTYRRRIRSRRRS